MAEMNVTSANKAVLTIGDTAPNAVPGAAAGMVIPLVQDITVSAAPGTVRYSVLSSASSSAFTTVNENNISLNMLVDELFMFGDSTKSNQVHVDGLFKTSADKTEVFFSVSFNGATSTTGEIYVSGKGFIGGLAPAAAVDAAVWLSPMEIIVNGELTKTEV